MRSDAYPDAGDRESIRDEGMHLTHQPLYRAAINFLYGIGSTCSARWAKPVATAEVESLQRQNKKLTHTLAVLSANDDFDIAEFEKQVKPVQQKLAAARTGLKMRKSSPPRERSPGSGSPPLSTRRATSLRHGRSWMSQVGRPCSATGCTTSRSLWSRSRARRGRTRSGTLPRHQGWGEVAHAAELARQTFPRSCTSRRQQLTTSMYSTC
jgi:hypothetical protein